jgi:hypothetical protein
MSRQSKVLRHSNDNALTFWCPGCDGAHAIQHGAGAGPRWGWNGSTDSPTFTPSILVRYPANPDAIEEFKEWRTQRVCHSFVTDGRIQFLDDCTHALAGQTVDLPEWED